MIMTIWWSKSARLLEFSRSFLRSGALLLAAPDRSEIEGGYPERYGEAEEGEGLILKYSSSWIQLFVQGGHCLLHHGHQLHSHHGPKGERTIIVYYCHHCQYCQNV